VSDVPFDKPVTLFNDLSCAFGPDRLYFGLTVKPFQYLIDLMNSCCIAITFVDDDLVGNSI